MNCDLPAFISDGCKVDYPIAIAIYASNYGWRNAASRDTIKATKSALKSC